ncbi:MAG TPA: hypothetical protein VMF07_11850 [Solirubrobacteraceae bacterium]|nr:hypothetical protein [Solirubrobacteraceae bacterium]
MSDFDDHLWSYLRTEHDADRTRAHRPSRSTPSRRPLIVRGTAALGAAIAATATTLIATSAPTPAFAVTRHHDGSITVKVNRESGIGGARRTLAAMGITTRLGAADRQHGFPASWSCTVIPGAQVDLTAMRADAAQDAAEGDTAAATALRAGAAAIANGTEPDVVYNCDAAGAGSG